MMNTAKENIGKLPIDTALISLHVIITLQIIKRVLTCLFASSKNTLLTLDAFSNCTGFSLSSR